MIDIFDETGQKGEEMEFGELIRKRYSVRNYQQKAVEDEKLNQVLEAARLAPSAANKQPFRLIVIKTRGREKELKRIYPAEWFTDAPILICACSVPSESWVRKDGKGYAEVDTTIALDHLILAATELGLGTCWVAAFDAEAAIEVLKLPEKFEPIAFTPLGYPADERGKKVRKKMSELLIKF